MIRKLIICLIFLSLPAFAETDERSCSIFSSWVHAVAIHKAGGVPAKDVIYSLEQHEAIDDEFKIVLQAIVDWLYDPRNPPITNEAEIAAVTYGSYQECLKERTKQRIL